ncbi:CHAT domain-containing protein [Mycena pura]|uniref:CHAT domain-containing protein n=1 Tax=Mycena pura TaxID=153505 RepID=A0AAD6Y7X8_9AGAR|nr:CHAT domain-containing protein [Mycena pura]
MAAHVNSHLDSSDVSESDANHHNFGVEIQQMQDLVAQLPPGHPDLSRYQHRLGQAFSQIYRASGNLNVDYLEAAIQHKHEAVKQAPDGHPDKAQYFQSLALSLSDRYQRLDDVEDLQSSLQANEEAVASIPEGHPQRPNYLQSLAVTMRDHYLRLGDDEDLEASLALNQEAVDLTPMGHTSRASHLQALAVSFTDRYQRFGGLDDLNAAVQHDQEAVDLTPPSHPDRADRLHSLAISLRDRYHELGNLDDLENALKYKQEVVERTPRGHPDRAGCLQSLGVAFGDRYRHTGDLPDLEAALQYKEEAVDITPANHPGRVRYLCSLAVSFTDRYQRLGELTDLAAALKNNQEAVLLTPAQHTERAARLQGLANSFGDRFQRLGDLEDLHAELKNSEEAVALTPDGHPQRADRVQTLALAFRDRYQRLWDPKDLDAAVHRCQEAVDLTAAGHPKRAAYLHSLAVVLGDKYQRFEKLADLEAALANDREAVNLISRGEDHPKRAKYLQNLAVSFGDRYERLEDLGDLDSALQLKQDAVDLTPQEHPSRAGYLQSLAVSFAARYQRLNDPSDLQAACTHYDESFQLPSLTPESAWKAALDWASFAEKFQPEDCIKAFSSAFRLLPEILWVGHTIPVRQDAIRRLEISRATSTATKACTNLSNLTVAVEVLEQGLATTFQQMLQLKTSTVGLEPDQAEKFQQLSMALYTGQLDSDDAMRLVNERNELLKDIRRQPGFAYFLLPKPYKVLRRAAQGGPVVILTSHQDSCDGLIIRNTTSEPVHVPLHVALAQLEAQHVCLAELLRDYNARTRGESASSSRFGKRERFTIRKTSAESFADILTWLWIHIVGPVYEALKSTDSAGSNYLRGVKQEIDKIATVVSGIDIECLEGGQATVDAVETQLKECSWLHLACHGMQNLASPTQSRLLLYEGSLDLGSILQMPLSNAEVVFLAACQTAMGDSELVNESFHLGGGFIAAGFRGAIGTLWSMNDKDGPFVAEKFYARLFGDGRRPLASDAAGFASGCETIEATRSAA